jgi:hypothetical protein
LPSQQSSEFTACGHRHKANDVAASDNYRQKETLTFKAVKIFHKIIINIQFPDQTSFTHGAAME